MPMQVQQPWKGRRQVPGQLRPQSLARQAATDRESTSERNRENESEEDSFNDDFPAFLKSRNLSDFIAPPLARPSRIAFTNCYTECSDDENANEEDQTSHENISLLDGARKPNTGC
ncbi:hypothetical protein MRB53_038895 [Persea americana]|nr:hypothetical protein MRB53_038895 [Persea americana]